MMSSSRIIPASKVDGGTKSTTTSSAQASDLTICVCTYNSSSTLEKCLASVKEAEPDSQLLVIDQHSTDNTVEIAKSYSAEIHLQKIGLGYARQLAFELTKTEFLAFVDGDEEIVQRSFFRKAMRILDSPDVGAVAGMVLGHRYAYGLPMGLLVLRSREFRGKVIPSSSSSREDYHVRLRLRSLGLSVVFVPDAMIHRSHYRRFKPEWEGANTRITCGLNLPQLAFILKVFILQSLNSRRLRNLGYVPFLYLKFLRGFVNPEAWRKPRLLD